jgi:hypothetical protein
VRLQLFVLAYNLGNFLRQAVLPRAVRHWTLTTFREKVIKIGAKVVRHARQVVFQMAEVAVPQELFRAILEGIQRLRLPTQCRADARRAEICILPGKQPPGNENGFFAFPEQPQALTRFL